MARPKKSRAAADDDDIDAITPCPLPPQEPQEPPSPRSGTPLNLSSPPVSPVHAVHDLRRLASSMSRSRSRSRSASPSSECEEAIHAGGAADNNNSSSSSSSRRRDSVKALEEGTDGDPERLWKRMLALQQIYGCYNSARMSAALSLGDFSLLLPSKACLDLLNEHMTLLPDEAERALGDWRFKSQGALHV